MCTTTRVQSVHLPPIQVSSDASPRTLLQLVSWTGEGGRNAFHLTVSSKRQYHITCSDNKRGCNYVATSHMWRSTDLVNVIL